MSEWVNLRLICRAFESHEYPIKQILKRMKLQLHPSHFANSEHEDIQLAPPLSICMTLLSTLIPALIFLSFFYLKEYIFIIFLYNIILNFFKILGQQSNRISWLPKMPLIGIQLATLHFRGDKAWGHIVLCTPSSFSRAHFHKTYAFLFLFFFFLLNFYPFFYLFYCMRWFDFVILLISYQSKSHI